ncbi:beta-lactamase/transpeptidase-like protein [Pluteus cervinus]|uniref:Beta-lactamase/transpeptidase-like protein n=1 Tax=Pluteus cervinus TaxID=181527 RepID=A0ACD3BC36_9AGAR|nr:beta-lactamase/transpeptidase-like protein [Pluteus cervinus]
MFRPGSGKESFLDLSFVTPFQNSEFSSPNDFRGKVFPREPSVGKDEVPKSTFTHLGQIPSTMVSLTNEGKANLQRIVTEAVQNGEAPAIVYGVSNLEGEIAFAQAGQRVLNDPSSGTVDKNSIFWVCSQTKLIGSLAVFQLIEQGKLTLDTPAAEVLPELTNIVVLDGATTRPAKSPILIRHLLNHTSGLFYVEGGLVPYGLPLNYVTAYPKEDPVGEFYRVLKGSYPGIPLKADPGTEYNYGYSTDTLGFVVQRLTGKSLEQYFKDHIFGPIGITAASFHRTSDLSNKAVSLSLRNEADRSLGSSVDRDAIIEHEPGQVNLHLAGVGLHISLADYLALLRHLLRIHAGLPVAHPIISQTTAKSLFQPTLNDKQAEMLNEWKKPHQFGDNFQWGNALCLNTTDWPGRRKKNSGWWFGWAGTYYFMDPTTGIAAVLGTQVVPSRDPEVISIWKRLEEALYAGLSNE